MPRFRDYEEQIDTDNRKPLGRHRKERDDYEKLNRLRERGDARKRKKNDREVN